MKSVYILGFCMITLFGAAQDTAYHYTVGTPGHDEAVAYFETADGFRVFGNTGEVGSGQSDIYVMDFDTNMDVVAVKTIGTSGLERLVSVKERNNTYILCATYYDGWSSNQYDVQISVVDSQLNVVESKTLEKQGVQSAVSLGLNNDDIFVLVQDYRHNSSTYSLVSLDAALNVQSELDIEMVDSFELSNVFVDTNVYLLGQIWPDDSVASEALLVEVLSTGYLIINSYGGAGDEIAFSMFSDSDSSYIITGSSNSYKDSDFDAYILKIDDARSTIWQQIHGYNPNVDNKDENGVNTILGLDGLLYTGLTTRTYGLGKEDFHCYRLGLNGNYQNGASFGFGNSEHLVSLTQDSDSSFVFLGNTNSESAGASDFLIVKVKAIPPGPNQKFVQFIDSISTQDFSVDVQTYIEPESRLAVSYTSDGLVVKSLDGSSLENVRLYDLKGSLIMSEDDVIGAYHFRSNYLDGVYLLVVRSEKGWHSTTKLFLK